MATPVKPAAPPSGGLVLTKATLPASPAGPANRPSASTTPPRPLPATLTESPVVRLKALIEKTCGTVATDVKVDLKPNGELLVGVKVRDLGAWDSAYNRLVALPELQPYTVSFNVDVAAP